MGFPNVVLSRDINKGLQTYCDTPEAMLLDVRTEEEYAAGHIPGSVNVPLDTIEDAIFDIVPEMNIPLFLYCLSGNRSIQAAVILRDTGYDNAVSIGGIEQYTGTIEKE